MPNQSAEGITVLKSIQNHPTSPVNLSSEPWMVTVLPLKSTRTWACAASATKPSVASTEPSLRMRFTAFRLAILRPKLIAALAPKCAAQVEATHVEAAHGLHMRQFLTGGATNFIPAKRRPGLRGYNAPAETPWRKGANALWARNPGSRGLSRGGVNWPLIDNGRFRDRTFKETQ